MSQKELNYIEDVYNHEKLIIAVLNNIRDSIDDESYDDILSDQTNEHQDQIKKIEKLMKGASNNE